MRRYSDNEKINSTSFASLEEEFGAPTYVVHRADLHQALLDRALELGAVLRTNVSCCAFSPLNRCQTEADLRQAHVEGVDFDKTLLKLRDQPALSHDLIIAADGIKSGIRSQMMARRGEVDETIPTGEAAYRRLSPPSLQSSAAMTADLFVLLAVGVILPRSDMEKDPELKALIDAPIATRWIGESEFCSRSDPGHTDSARSRTFSGPDAHVVAYPIKAQNAFNIVTTHISNTVGLTEDWTARASKDLMLQRFEGWTETLLKCLRLAPPGDLVEWALRIHLPLTGWIDGNTVLLADSAHATLPHIAQGAAQAGEDAAVLSTLLAKCQTTEDVPAALRMYEKLRKPRADWAVEMARVTGTLCTFFSISLWSVWDTSLTTLNVS